MLAAKGPNSEEPPAWVAQLLKGLATPIAKNSYLNEERNKTSSNKKKKKKKKPDAFAEVEMNMKKSFDIQMMSLDYNSMVNAKKQKYQNKYEVERAAHISQIKSFERNELLLDTQARAQANFMYTHKPMRIAAVSKKPLKAKSNTMTTSIASSNTSEFNLAFSSNATRYPTTPESEEPNESNHDNTEDDTSDETEDNSEGEDDSSNDEDESSSNDGDDSDDE